MKSSEKSIKTSKIQLTFFLISSLTSCYGLFKSLKILIRGYSRLISLVPQTLNKQLSLKKINALIDEKQSKNKEIIYIDKIVCNFPSFKRFLLEQNSQNYLKIPRQASDIESTLVGIYKNKKRQVFINIDIKEAYLGRELIYHINKNTNKKLLSIDYGAAFYGQLFYKDKNLLTLNAKVIGLNRRQILSFWSGPIPYYYCILVLSSVVMGIAISIGRHQPFLSQLNFKKYFNLI